VSERALDPTIVDAYLGAVDWLRSILGRSEVAVAWPERSAVADYTVGGIAAHAVHGVLWLEQLLKDPEPAGLRRVTIATTACRRRCAPPQRRSRWRVPRR